MSGQLTERPGPIRNSFSEGHTGAKPVNQCCQWNWVFLNINFGAESSRTAKVMQM